MRRFPKSTRSGKPPMGRRTLTAWVGALVVGLLWGSLPSPLLAKDRAIGDTKVFATVPYPGHPGGIVVDGRTVYVDTFNALDRELDDYDAVFAYNLLSGKLRPTRPDQPNPIIVPRMMPAGAFMGLAGMALDASGRLYVADMNGRIVRVNPRTGAQEDYASFPTSTATSLTNMPGDVVFDGDGNLYVSDASGAPVIWRVPPGGGAAQAWFVDPRLASDWFDGTGGIRIDPTGRYLYFAVGNMRGPTIYRLPLADPQSSKLEIFHLYEPVFPAAATTGIVFGDSGRLYVMLGLANQVSVLRADGTEERRFPTLEENQNRDVPYAFPMMASFDGDGSLLLTNVGSPAEPSEWVVFDVWVADIALPLERPDID